MKLPNWWPYDEPYAIKDSLFVMRQLPDDCIDLIVTSPNYNIGIEYGDNVDDNLPYEKYIENMVYMFNEMYRILKSDGRLCINAYFSCGTAKQRFTPLFDFDTICKEIGFKHNSVIVWDDRTVCKKTAFGSFKSASSPYINCLHPDSLVISERGIVPIKNINTQDNVIDKNGEYSPVKITQKRSHTGNMRKITMQCNLVDPILCTDEHKFLVKERTISFKGYPYNRKYIFSDPTWMSAKDINPVYTHGRKDEKKIYIAHSIDKHSDLPIIENSLDLHNPKFYWLVGLYLAEGSIRNNLTKRKGYDIYFTVNIKEKNYISTRFDNLGINYRIHEQENFCRFEMSSKELYYFVRTFYKDGSHAIKGTKAHLKEVPEWVVRLPAEHLKELVDGYFFGDGCTFQKRKTEGKMIVSTSKAMLIQFQRILFKLGKYARITLACKAKDIYFNNGSKISHCKERYNLIWYDHVTQYSPAYFEGNIVWTQVKLVEDINYDGEVYDLSVGTHTFLLPQGISHNSPCEGILVMYKHHWKKAEKGENDITGREFANWTIGRWTMAPDRRTEGHPTTFPVELPLRCMKLFSYVGDVVFDPFVGSGTTILGAKMCNRIGIGVDIEPKYKSIIENKINSYIPPKDTEDYF